MATKNWFDLSIYNSKIQRIEIAQGHNKLQLSVPLSRIEKFSTGQDYEDYVVSEGWVLLEEKNSMVTLENFGTYSRMTEISRALLSFFTDLEIEKSITPITLLKQNEIIDGLKNTAKMPISTIEKSIYGVDQASQERIVNSIQKARKFSSDVENNLAINKRKISGHLQFLYDCLGDELVSKLGETEINGVDPDVFGYTTVLYHLDNVLKRGVVSSDIRDVSVRHSILTDLNFMVDAYDKHKSVYQNCIDNVVQLMIDNPISINDEIFFEKQLPYVRSIFSNQILSTVLFDYAKKNFKWSNDDCIGAYFSTENTSLDDLKEEYEILVDKFPMAVKRDSQVSTKSMIKVLKACNRAIDVIAEAFQVPIETMLPNLKEHTLFIVNNLKSSVEGYQNGVNNAEAHIEAITISINGSAFVHEFGHLIDSSLDLTVEERDKLNALAMSNENLEEYFINQDKNLKLNIANMSPDRQAKMIKDREYLSSPVELFARNFEAYFVNKLVNEGDLNLLRIGGAYTLDHMVLAAPIGKPELTQAFFDGLREHVAPVRDVSYENSSSLQFN